MLSKLICAAALTVWGVVTAYAAPVLSVTPTLTNVFVGNSFTVDINIEDVSDLYAWQLDVSYGPAGLLGATTRTVGGFLGGGQTFGGGTADDSLPPSPPCSALHPAQPVSAAPASWRV